MQELRPICLSTERDNGKQFGGYAGVEIVGAFSVGHWFGVRSGGSWYMVWCDVM